MKIYHVLSAALIILSLFLAACGTFEVDTTAEIVTPTATPAPPTPSPEATPEAVVDTPEPTEGEDESHSPFDATYADAFAGIAMDHPAEWEITAVEESLKQLGRGYTTTFTSWISGPGGGGGIPEGGTKVDLSVEPTTAGTLQDAAAQRREELERGESTILSEGNVRLDSGLEGVTFRVESVFGQGEQTITIINGYLITFGGVGDAALLDQILNTLRPLDTAGEAQEPHPVQATAVQAIIIANNGSPAPIYSGPGDAFPQVASVESGLALAVSGISPDTLWYQLEGCRAQNPNRPAPACWISADPSIASPIRAITPSQQPMQPTEKLAVLVLADQFAPVHSGPDATYPVISHLAGGFSFAITGVSEDGNWWRLAGCTSPLNEELDECWISADPDVTEALDEPLAAIFE